MIAFFVYLRNQKSYPLEGLVIEKPLSFEWGWEAVWDKT